MDFRGASRSLVEIGVPDGAGSGVIVESGVDYSLILTCKHVVQGFADVKLLYRTTDKRFRKAVGSVLRVDDSCDLALIKSSTKLQAPPVKLGEHDPDLYEQVYSVANPQGYFGVPATGYVAGIGGSHRGRKDRWLLQMPCAQGASGGPVMDLDDNLIGLVSDLARDGTALLWNLTLAVPLSSIRGFLSVVEAPLVPCDDNPGPLTEV